MKYPKVAIFTLTKNRLDYTKKTFENLWKFTHIPYDHYIIDNGSVDGTVEYLKTLSDRVTKVIYNPQNRGLSVAYNQALDEIGNGYDYIMSFDNDCEIITDNWLLPIVDIMRSMEDRVLLSPHVEGLDPNVEPPRQEYLTVNGYRVGITNHLGGISLIAPAWIFRDYRFPTNLPLHGNQDVWFSYHVQNKLGLRMGYVEDIVVRHMDEAPTAQETVEEYFETLSRERSLVYGEHPLLTKVLRPFRRVRYIRAANKAGISDRTILSSVADKLSRKLNKTVK